MDKVKIFSKLTKADIIMIIFLICIIIISVIIVFFIETQKSCHAICVIDKKKAREIDLDKNQFINLNNGMVLEVKDGKIRVCESDCPNKICVKKGWISSSNDAIICLPNRTIIFIEEDSEIDYISR